MSLLKMAKFASEGLEVRIDQMENRSKCKTCFLNNAICICSAVKKIFEDSASKGDSNYDIKVFMHSKEWGRASNTGKLLPLGMKNASLSLYGIESDRIALLEQLSTNPSLILYPNKDAKPLSEYKDWFAQTSAEGKRVTICVIDSTWGQSVAMDKSLPAHIPRVKIDEMVLKPSLFLNRKQSKERVEAKRVSTVGNTTPY
jgi:DTW domain-containing protein YfiP